jgi:hypothetical protein
MTNREGGKKNTVFGKCGSMKTSLGVAPTVHPISLVEGHLWDAEKCVVYGFDAEHELYGEGDCSVPTACEEGERG